jgi:hypothetical protein
LFANRYVHRLGIVIRRDEKATAKELIKWGGDCGENADLVRSVISHIRRTDPMDASQVAAFYVKEQGVRDLQLLKSEDPKLIELLIEVLTYQGKHIDSGGSPGKAPRKIVEVPVAPLNRECVQKLLGL